MIFIVTQLMKDCIHVGKVNFKTASLIISFPCCQSNIPYFIYGFAQMLCDTLFDMLSLASNNFHHYSDTRNVHTICFGYALTFEPVLKLSSRGFLKLN